MVKRNYFSCASRNSGRCEISINPLIYGEKISPAALLIEIRLVFRSLSRSVSRDQGRNGYFRSSTDLVSRRPWYFCSMLSDRVQNEVQGHFHRLKTYRITPLHYLLSPDKS